MGVAGPFECKNEGEYLLSCDFEAYGGRGSVVWTALPERALRFPSVEKAMRFVRTVPKCNPVRPDGKPNRPLTAYHILIEEAP